jgi:serine O-acetyltransferase
MHLEKAYKQLQYLLYELRIIAGKHWGYWLTMWLGGSAGVICSYRLDRALFLILGKYYPYFRIFLYPLFLFLRILSTKHEISYRADIGKGLKILHPSLGIVVSRYTICGENLTLTGGNCIGGRKRLKDGDVVIDNNVHLGANAMIMGPVKIGSHCVVGAGAVVVNDTEENVVLAGVPAKVIKDRKTIE